MSLSLLLLTDSLRFTAPVSYISRRHKHLLSLKPFSIFFFLMHLRQEALLGQMATFRIHSEFLKWEGWTILEVALWPPHAKSWLIGKDSDAGRDWGQEEKGTTEDEMAIWHHWLDRRESEWTPGVGDGQGGLACFNSWGRKESDMTERLIWSNLINAGAAGDAD